VQDPSRRLLGESVPDADRPDVRRLLGPVLREPLSARIASGEWGGRVLSIGRRAVGIVLLDLRFRDAIVLRWRVDRRFRRGGLGERLIERAAEEAIDRGKRRLRLFLPRDCPGAAGVHRILDRRGWSPPRDRATLFRVDTALAGPPWSGPPRIRSLSTVPWEDASAGERRLAEAPGAFAELPPRPVGLRDWHPRASGILRKNGRPVGWLLAEEWAPRRYHVPVVQVDPACQRTGGLLCLVRHFLAAVREEGPVLVSWSVDRRNDRLLRWLGRRWIPEGATARPLEERFYPPSD
jgi:GNAT superfamily N-acetyltransferase